MLEDDLRTRNLRAVERLYQSERDRDLAVWVTLWSPSGRQTFPTLGEAATVAGIAALRAVTKEKFETRPPYGIRVEAEAMADPARVLDKLQLDFAAAPPIRLWCLFHFDEAGLIEEVEEIFDRGVPAFDSADETSEKADSNAWHRG